MRFIKGKGFLMYLCFPFITVFWVWTKKKWNVTGRIAFTVWAALALFFGIVSASASKTTPTAGPATTSKSTTNPKPSTNKPSADPTKSTTPSLQSQIQQSVADAISGNAMNDKQRDEGVNVTQNIDDGSWIVTVSMWVDDGFNTKQQVQAELQHAYDVDKVLFSKYKNIGRISYQIDAPFKDQYGNVTNDLWFRFVIQGTDGYKINYANEQPTDLIQFYDLQFAHPDAQNAWNELTASD